jgi:hypothetical protein
MLTFACLKKLDWYTVQLDRSLSRINKKLYEAATLFKY